MCGWGPYAREASVWEACCWYSGVINMFLNCLTEHDGRDLDGRSEGRAGVRREILEGGGDSGRQRDEIVGAERDFRRDQGLTGLVGGVLQQHRALARAL